MITAKKAKKLAEAAPAKLEKAELSELMEEIAIFAKIERLRRGVIDSAPVFEKVVGAWREVKLDP